MVRLSAEWLIRDAQASERLASRISQGPERTALVERALRQRQRALIAAEALASRSGQAGATPFLTTS